MSELTLSQFENYETRHFKTTDDLKTFIEDFYYAHEDITRWDLSKWTISTSIKKFDYLFANCKNLQYLDLSNWETVQIESVKYMFRRCFNLESIKLVNWSTESLKITDHALDDTKSPIKDIRELVSVGSVDALLQSKREKEMRERAARRRQEAIQLTEQLMQRENSKFNDQLSASPLIQTLMTETKSIPALIELTNRQSSEIESLKRQNAELQITTQTEIESLKRENNDFRSTIADQTESIKSLLAIVEQLKNTYDKFRLASRAFKTNSTSQ